MLVVVLIHIGAHLFLLGLDSVTEGTIHAGVIRIIIMDIRGMEVITLTIMIIPGVILIRIITGVTGTGIMMVITMDFGMVIMVIMTQIDILLVTPIMDEGQ